MPKVGGIRVLIEVVEMDGLLTLALLENISALMKQVLPLGG